MKIARLTLSDRATQGIYQDESGPEIERVISSIFQESIEWQRCLLPDDLSLIAKKLFHFADKEKCHLILTTGGTGPSARDVTPEATRQVLEKELPGFGEAMRAYSFSKVKTAILSRAIAGVRGPSLIINLPGNPKAIQECLEILGPAIAECLDHISGFRPKLA
ncbi:MAG: molybdopterin adenylyltransferase [Verrucomicrobiae bacterium]|nr:molybdopterin adenylyltransferase [Verrucomicrobiae bacterium]